MAHVMDAGADRGAGSDTAGRDDAAERRPEMRVSHRRPSRGHEERGRLGLGELLVPQPGVGGQRLHRAWRQGHFPGFAEFGGVHGQHALSPVDLAAFQAKRLPDPHPRGGEQPGQRLVGSRPQRRADDAGHLAHQRLDIGVGVDERRPPAPAVRQQPGRRHLRARIDPSHVAGEPAGHGHPPGRHLAARPGLRLLRPCQGGLHGDDLGTGVIEVGNEAGKQPGCLGQLMPEHPADAQVLLRPPGQGAHCPAPGHGRATVRSAARSTLAYTEVVARSRCRSTWLISTRSLPCRSISLASA